jgi:radical SAM/Cys-rich protein
MSCIKRRLSAIAQKSVKDKFAAHFDKTRRVDNMQSIPTFESVIPGGAERMKRKEPHTLILNLGLYCNQTCTHCHVESSPERTETMTRENVDRVLDLLSRTPSIKTLDITGGAPELQPQFRYLVTEARKLGLNLNDRCNLTCLTEPGQEDLAEFLAENKFRIIASLPCYSKKNVNQQRGSGVFGRSITGLEMLNERGYGKPETGLLLELVYNPNGAFLAPAAEDLEPVYRKELMEHFGIVFTSLHSMNNMPVKRFADYLERRGELQKYMELLVNNFNDNFVDDLMCLDSVNIGWDGNIYDCDFNQQMDLYAGGTVLGTIWNQDSLIIPQDKKVVLGKHCFGCTAGKGSK